MSDEELSEQEFTQMIHLMDRYVRTQMDQWEQWKFDTPQSTIFVNISMRPLFEGTEDSFDDLNHILDK